MNTTPKTNTEFWLAKFKRNVENNRVHQNVMEKMGWKVIVLWQCEIEKHFDETMALLETRLKRKEFDNHERN